MTPKQSEFIDILLDQIGYRDSPLKSRYRDKFFKYAPKVEYASTVIERLLGERRIRRGPRKRRQPTDHIAISDLAAYAFCPASYAIKETFDVTQIPGVEEGLEHRKGDSVERLLERIKLRNSYSSETSFLFTEAENAFYADVLNSEIIIRGYDEQQKRYVSIPLRHFFSEISVASRDLERPVVLA